MFMKKFIFLFLLLAFCSQNTEEEVSSSELPINEISFTYINSDIEIAKEDFTDKQTIIVFWADYWSICRQELPVLEEELANLTDKYDVLALAHSEYGPTLDWVSENLNGELKIGFSTSELRDYFRVVGQPITLILDTNGEVIYREFGAIDFSSF